MSGANRIQRPHKVPRVKTKYREIKTEIPNKNSMWVHRDLDKYEARGMRGRLPIVWDKAEDFQVFDKHGNKWIDFTSTIFVTNTGHSNPQVLKAIRKQLDQKLINSYTNASEIRAKFLKKLIEVTPSFCEKAFLVSSGTEATEAAMKLMKSFGQTIHPKKIGIVSWIGSMHGKTMAAEMLRGDHKSSEWIGYRDPNMYHLPFPYEWEVGEDEGAARFKKDIAKLKKSGVNFDRLCGFMIESFQGRVSSFYPKSYIKELAKFAKKHRILITFDEVQSGMGRTGKFFAFEHYEVTPDLVCVGKGFGDGVPIAGVIGRRKILDIPEDLSSTHSANPLVCAAGLANLEFIESRNLVKEAARKGKIFHAKLNELKREFPERIPYITGRGMIAAVFFVNPKTGKHDSNMVNKVTNLAVEKGLLVMPTSKTIKIGPPLTIPDKALVEGVEVLRECLHEILD